MKTALLTVALGLFCGSVHGQDLVYRAKNPAFGGETFNYNWLLSSAQVQDLIEDPKVAERQSSSTLNDFAESLNRQLLNQLSRQLVTSQFGEQGLEEGFYSFGNFQIDVTNGIEGLVVTIVDTGAGEQTQIVIPYF